MKKIVIFCLLGITVLLCTACEFTPIPDTVTVSGNTKTITRVADSVESGYTIIFEGLDFKHNNNASINIVAVRSSEKEKARVEVTYSEQFDNYFFGISILDETILVRVDSEYQYDIDTFDMTIYAHFDKVEMNGGGYKASINTWGISDLNIGYYSHPYLKVFVANDTVFTICNSKRRAPGKGSMRGKPAGFATLSPVFPS